MGLFSRAADYFVCFGSDDVDVDVDVEDSTVICQLGVDIGSMTSSPFNLDISMQTPQRAPKSPTYTIRLLLYACSIQLLFLDSPQELVLAHTGNTLHIVSYPVDRPYMAPGSI